MKIQFISNYSQLYGANRVLLSILDYFHSNGYEISVILPSKGEMSEELEKKKIPFVVTTFFPSFLYLKFSFKYVLLPFLTLLNVIKFSKITSIIKKFNPDIIYSNTSAENIGILVAKKLNKKHISHIHEFMSLDHGAFFWAGKKAKKKYINQSDGIIFVSKSVAKYVMIGEPLSPKHIVIYNGITSPEYRLLEKELPIEINFGIVGILAPGKGQHLAFKYFKEILSLYPNARLHVFGDKSGAYKEGLIRLVQELNLKDKIIFHGFERNTNKIFEQLDALLMFSRSEGFGIVTVEAMLRGVPVIGFDNAGTSELITHQNTGLLFQDYNSFKQSVDYLFYSKENYNTIRSNAFENASIRFNELNYCKNIEKFILQTINY